jgi:hypothetical protein
MTNTTEEYLFAITNNTLTRRVIQMNNNTFGPSSSYNYQFTDDGLPILSIVLPIVAILLFCICCAKALMSRA